MNEQTRQPEEETVAMQAEAVEAKSEPVTPEVITDEEEDSKVTYMSAEEYERAKMEQNLPLAAVAGIVTGVVLAAAWAAFAIWTGVFHSYFAILIGLAVGFVVKKAGRAVESKFAILAAVLAVVSCALAMYLGNIGIIASNFGYGYFEALSHTDFSQIPTVMKATFEPIDLLFYGLALVSAYGVGSKNVKVV